MRYNEKAALLLRNLLHKDNCGDYSDYDILAGDGPTATKTKIRALENMLVGTSRNAEQRIKEIKEQFSICRTDPPGNEEIWNLQEFRLDNIHQRLSSDERYFGYSATINHDILVQTDRGLIAYPIQRGANGVRLDYVDVSNELVVYSNLRENFCGSFVNFQYKQDYQWFKNLYDGIFSFKK